MKKVLLVVAMLLLAVPVMAATSITAVCEGTPTQVGTVYIQTVRIDYSSTVDVRAFALDINATAGVSMKNIRGYKTGENTASSKGYGIFPSRFRDFVNPSNPDPCYALETYNPTPAWNEPDTITPPTGMGYAKFTAELGTLFAGDANKPALSGTLFRFDVNSEGIGGPNTVYITVAKNATRGGIVGADAAEITGVVYTGTSFVIPGGGVTVPNVLTNDRLVARSAITAVGLNPVEVNVPPTAAGQLRTIIAQNPVGGTVVTPGSNVTINAVSYPVKDAAPATLYTNWVNRNRPQAWAYPRQCRGDADGKKQGLYWVGSNDLAVLRAAISKTEAQLGGIVVNGNMGITADFTHSKQGLYWVGSNDLAILRAYISKGEASVPLCGAVPSVPSADANYWYYCIPTGGTCPAGQICAPAGICPNTP